MKKTLSFFFSLCLAIYLLIAGEIRAQEPVAANGKFVTVKGLKIYYEESGNGMPLVLLHGFGRTSSDWKPSISELSKYYRVIAIDLPGHGRSDFMDTTDVYLHKKAAEYLIWLLDTLKIDSTHIMGISSGGFITLYMATIKPQLTKRIAVIGGQVYYSSITRNVISAQGQPNNPRMRTESLSVIHGQQKAVLIGRQFWNFRKLYGDPSFTPDVLATIKAKSLIIHGDNDPIAPVSNAWEMYRSIPNANLWVVPNGGHVPNAIPSNHDDFMRRIMEFFRGDWDRRPN
jgi:pimeloyl-ACP methyl ester carboxylesterase